MANNFEKLDDVDKIPKRGEIAATLKDGTIHYFNDFEEIQEWNQENMGTDQTVMEYHKEPRVVE